MKQFNYVSGLPELVTLNKFEKDGKRTYILPNGTHAISVTTMLGHFKKKAIQAWRDRVGHEEANKISNRASTHGTKFHNLLQKYLENTPLPTLLNDSVMPNMKQAFYDMESTLDRIDNIHYIESSLYSEKMRLAGRIDVIAEFDGVLSVIDFKTSSKVKTESMIEDYFLQATCYALMFEERTDRPIDQIVIIISTDGLNEPQVFIKSKMNYIDNIFEKILTFHREIKT